MVNKANIAGPVFDIYLPFFFALFAENKVVANQGQQLLVNNFPVKTEGKYNVSENTDSDEQKRCDQPEEETSNKTVAKLDTGKVHVHSGVIPSSDIRRKS